MAVGPQRVSQGSGEPRFSIVEARFADDDYLHLGEFISSPAHPLHLFLQMKYARRLGSE
ncbi:MAG TPA: hypothetical protein VFN21_06725 [Acidimicrobiales bacterium]|nr:hypothetical protein [Acidimicrobiales bacterium]